MSVDIMEETYYLTAKGWETKRPKDEKKIVEVWDLDVYWAVGWDEEYHHWTCMWVTDSPVWDLAKCNALRHSFPFPDMSDGRDNCAASVGWPLPESRPGAYGMAAA